MRVYVPATLAMLQKLVADGSLRPLNGTAFAVTPTLREAYAEGDEDELADVALREAAMASAGVMPSDRGTRSSTESGTREAAAVTRWPRPAASHRCSG